MRNNIISLEKYFSIFAYLLVVRLKGQCKMNSYIEFFPNCKQTDDRKANIEKYLCKEIYYFVIYLGIYFLADKGNCQDFTL